MLRPLPSRAPGLRPPAPGPPSQSRCPDEVTKLGEAGNLRDEAQRSRPRPPAGSVPAGRAVPAPVALLSGPQPVWGPPGRSSPSWTPRSQDRLRRAVRCSWPGPPGLVRVSLRAWSLGRRGGPPPSWGSRLPRWRARPSPSPKPAHGDPGAPPAGRAGSWACVNSCDAYSFTT